ncbi:MAG: energy-coupling factor ABC transporter permease [Spirochaetaceae bacterium]|jgi:cobalt/nickel transport system permease protein|nr:energy-coupling factor ABC transporter permease [Spirochaetaceae bacterium]
MHMADALLSPQVGGVMLAASAAAIGFSLKKTARDSESGLVDEKKIPLMGIMGAFVFAGQMINFTIPGTGSSGHIGGGILLAALLGPAGALITLASVLLIQCLFFADGGLLAYGCNVFNMGVTSCIITYSLIYKPIVSKGLSKKSITVASILAVTAGLLAGSFFVVLETLISGVTELPFGTFVALMLPIHLAIGLVEGIVTAAVLCFVYSARPEILDSTIHNKKIVRTLPVKKVLIVFAVLTVLVAGGLSIFASAYPDGLEWSMEKTAGTTELERDGAAYTAAADIVEKTAFMPDYGFKNSNEDSANIGTASAGIIGSIITLVLAGGIGFIIYGVRKRKEKA